MLIHVKVFPKAKQNSVTVVTQNMYRVKTTAPATNNQANMAVIKLLAKHFAVKKSQVFLVAGKTSREKIFEIL